MKKEIKIFCICFICIFLYVSIFRVDVVDSYVDVVDSYHGKELTPHEVHGTYERAIVVDILYSSGRMGYPSSWWFDPFIFNKSQPFHLEVSEDLDFGKPAIRNPLIINQIKEDEWHYVANPKEIGKLMAYLTIDSFIAYLILIPFRLISKYATEEQDDISTATTCLACGTIIPSGEDICSKCGWSYKE